jgi:hypothetical protein
MSQIESIEKFLTQTHKFKNRQSGKKVSKHEYVYNHKKVDLKLILKSDLSNFELIYTCPQYDGFADELVSSRKNIENTVGDKNPLTVMQMLIDWAVDELRDGHSGGDDVDGFSDELPDNQEDMWSHDELVKSKLPRDIVSNKDRVLDIYVWGKKHRKHLPHRVDYNFNAAVIHGKKKGTDWTRDGRSEEIRKAVMRSPAFESYFRFVLEKIEKNDCKTIGVNCRAGRHRSVTIAVLLQMHYYSGSRIHYLEIK